MYQLKSIFIVKKLRQIVHYPGSEDYRSIQDQSKIHFQNQGLIVKQDA
jgi:hypothetical protein